MNMVGFDLGKFKSYIVVENDGGSLIFDKKVKTTRGDLRTLFGALGRCSVLMEASTPSEWVARLLESLGHDVIVADPNFALMYARRDKTQKTDRRDALALLQALKVGAFHRAVRRTDEEMLVKAILSSRDSLVRTRTKLVNRLKSTTLRFGEIDVENVEARNFADAVRRDCSLEPLLEILEPTLRALDAASREIRELDAKLEEKAAQSELVQRLAGIPGVGRVVALGFVYALSDVKRFDNADKVAAYLGLVPSVTASGEVERRGGITKRGDCVARTLLHEAAQSIVNSKRNPLAKPLRDATCALASRRGGKKRGGNAIARSALARRLARIMFAMWRDGTTFTPELTLNQALKSPPNKEA